MIDVEKIADESEMIVNGYAFTKCDLGYRVLNLYDPQKAIVLSANGEMLETSMDGIEEGIVKSYFEKNRDVLEASDA